MQEIEQDEEETKTTQAPADPTSQPLQPVIPQGVDAQDDDPEEIFLNAVAEIDTQPLVQVKRRRAGTFTIADVLEVVFLVSVLLVGFFGILWQCITFPHTLVILYAVEKPASLTTTLDISTRTLASVTLTRESTSPTTGHAHQDAQAATGTVT